MAEAFGHIWGQILGELFEPAFRSLMQSVAERTGVYLDYSGNARSVRRGRKRMLWADVNGSRHQLDYVFERGGTRELLGTPVGFVELAWRRYTKHSKNKVQEIQAAVLPIAQKYRYAQPFLGAILGGSFTRPSVQQLLDSGFRVVYIQEVAVTLAFRAVGIDASCSEATTEAEYAQKIHQYRSLADSDRRRVQEHILHAEPQQLAEFVSDLESTITRTIQRIVVLPLHGNLLEAASVRAAIRLLSGYSDDGTSASVNRYEIEVRYSTGATVRGEFPTKSEAIAFLRTL